MQENTPQFLFGRSKIQTTSASQAMWSSIFLARRQPEMPLFSPIRVSITSTRRMRHVCGCSLCGPVCSDSLADSSPVCVQTLGPGRHPASPGHAQADICSPMAGTAADLLHGAPVNRTPPPGRWAGAGAAAGLQGLSAGRRQGRAAAGGYCLWREVRAALRRHWRRYVSLHPVLWRVSTVNMSADSD